MDLELLNRINVFREVRVKQHRSHSKRGKTFNVKDYERQVEPTKTRMAPAIKLSDGTIIIAKESLHGDAIRKAYIQIFPDKAIKKPWLALRSTGLTIDELNHYGQFQRSFYGDEDFGQRGYSYLDSKGMQRFISVRDFGRMDRLRFREARVRVKQHRSHSKRGRVFNVKQYNREVSLKAVPMHVLDKIVRQGIKRGPVNRAGNKKRPPSVYFTESEDDAHEYGAIFGGRSKDKTNSGDYAIIAFTIPEADFKKAIKDEYDTKMFHGQNSWRLEHRDVPADWIKSIKVYRWNKGEPELVKELKESTQRLFYTVVLIDKKIREATTTVDAHTSHSKLGKVFNVKQYERKLWREMPIGNLQQVTDEQLDRFIKDDPQGLTAFYAKQWNATDKLTKDQRHTMARLLKYTTPGGPLHQFHPGAVTIYRGGRYNPNEKKARSWALDKKTARRFGDPVRSKKLSLNDKALDLDKVLGAGKSEKEVITEATIHVKAFDRRDPKTGKIEHVPAHDRHIKPVVNKLLYHGGNPNKASTSHDDLVYFTKNKSVADSYVNMYNDRAGEGGKVHTARVTISNPAPEDVVLSAAKRFGIDNEEQGLTPASAFDGNIHGKAAVRKLRAYLVNKGYTGTILQDIAYGQQKTTYAAIPFFKQYVQWMTEAQVRVKAYSRVRKGKRQQVRASTRNVKTPAQMKIIGATPNEEIHVRKVLARHDPRVLAAVPFVAVLDRKDFMKMGKNNKADPNYKFDGFEIGWYDEKKGFIAINRTPLVANEFQAVLDHELGHAAYYHSPELAEWNRAARDPKFDRFTWYAKQEGPHEGFAETYMAYIAAGGRAKQTKYKKAFAVVRKVISAVNPRTNLFDDMPLPRRPK